MTIIDWLDTSTLLHASTLRSGVMAWLDLNALILAWAVMR